MLSPEEAVELVKNKIRTIESTEEVSLWETGGRVLAEAVTAGHNQPPFPRSPLDGYAVRSCDTKGASRECPVSLRVVDEVLAGGRGSVRVTEKTAVRIMTGAMLPEGADTVVAQEKTDYGEKEVKIYQELSCFENYCFAGEDYKKGELLLREGTILTSAEAGILSSLGRPVVKVKKRVRAALLTTGDELLLPGEKLVPGKIYNSNLFLLGHRLRELSADLTVAEQVADEIEIVTGYMGQVLEQVDILVTTGGISVGKKDILHEALERLPVEKLFSQVSMKPGMRTAGGVYKGKPVFCLSGNPFAAAVGMELLVRPVLAWLRGEKNTGNIWIPVKFQGEYAKKSQIPRYLRGFYENGRVSLSDKRDFSGSVSPFYGSNCLVQVPAGKEGLREGEDVWVLMR